MDTAENEDFIDQWHEFAGNGELLLLADRVYIMDRGEIVHAGVAGDLDDPEMRRHLIV